VSEEFFRDLKRRGTQSDWVDKMQTRKELYELLDYDPNADNWPIVGDREFVQARIAAKVDKTR